jgi:ferredoxin--NADP+ reductase
MSLAFLQPSALPAPATAGLQTFASQQQPPVPNTSAFAGASAPTVASLAALVGAGVAVGAKATQRRATAVKKKGVKVVEGKEIPWNLFSPKAPYKAKVISNETITKKSKLVNWETTHTIIDHDGNMPYVEGQSAGVIAPGPDKKGQTPAKIRLYSIASSACGDDETSKTVSLCVKRVVEVSGKSWCEYSNIPEGQKDPEYPDAEKVYRGVCSSHICDLKAGDDVLLTGPTGAEMLLPQDPDSNIIMLATGTGIAPFRSFLRYLFHDKATKGKFQGAAWLFLGVPFSESLLYDEEWKKMEEEFPDQFRFDYAISDEEKRPDGSSMYVQHRVMEYIEDVWPMVKDKKTHVYMCGLKGMATGLEEAFGPSCEKEGINVKEFIKQMKKEHRYHVEVY